MTLNDKTIIYVTREIERALGIAPSANYLIVSNKTQYGETIKKEYPDFVTLVENPAKELLGTTELLNHETTRNLVAKYPDALILVFKNTMRVEAVMNANKWKFINPKSTLAERVENKISQIRWLGNVGIKYLPPHAAKVARMIIWKNDPFVLQWAHGHTGDGTTIIRNRDDLSALQAKFPERIARISTYIAGPSFTTNAIVTENKILMGNVSYQITGMPPFTENEFSTVGNDWGIAKKLLTPENVTAIENIVNEIGQKMYADGWRGLFGVDVIRDDASKRMFLIEVNARQPASATFESTLQEKAREKGVRGLTTFEAHIRALLGLPIDQELIAINDGAQIVQRVTKNVQGVFDDVTGSLKSIGYDVIAYQNTAHNSDLLRIQSSVSIMDSHKAFNSKGKEILNEIKGSQIKIQV